MEKSSAQVQHPGQIQAKEVFFDNQLLTYREAARYLSVSESYLRRLKQEGRIAFVAIGNRNVRFRVASLNRFIDRQEMT